MFLSESCVYLSNYTFEASEIGIIGSKLRSLWFLHGCPPTTVSKFTDVNVRIGRKYNLCSHQRQNRCKYVILFGHVLYCTFTWFIFSVSDNSTRQLWYRTYGEHIALPGAMFRGIPPREGILSQLTKENIYSYCPVRWEYRNHERSFVDSCYLCISYPFCKFETCALLSK